MKDHNQWFLEKLAAGMSQGDAEAVASLILRLQDEEKRRTESTREAGTAAAMLADVAEIFFGDDCNKEKHGHVPRVLSHVHFSWAAGPTRKNVSWLRTATILWKGREGLSAEDVQGFEQWEGFLEKLKELT